MLCLLIDFMLIVVGIFVDSLEIIKKFFKCVLQVKIVQHTQVSFWKLKEVNVELIVLIKKSIRHNPCDSVQERFGSRQLLDEYNDLICSLEHKL